MKKAAPPQTTVVLSPAAWIATTRANRVLDFFGTSELSPLCSVLIPASLDTSALDASRIRTELKLGAATWHLRTLDAEGMVRLAWFCSDRAFREVAVGGTKLLLIAGDSGDVAEWPLARAFFPSFFREKGAQVHSQIRSVAQHSPGFVPSIDLTSSALTALRWTLAETPVLCFLSCPSKVPVALLHALLARGAEELGTMLGKTVGLAGPVPAKGIDARSGVCEMIFDLTILQKTISVSVFMPFSAAQLLIQNLKGEGNTGPQTASTVVPPVALNRLLMDATIRTLAAARPAKHADDIAWFFADHLCSLGSHDVTLLVQNWLVPLGTAAVLDFFFPRGSYRPSIWERVHSPLGQKLTIPLALALKEGQNRESGLSEADAGLIVRAVRSGKLALSPRGSDVILKILGGFLNLEYQKELDILIQADIPGILLARLPAVERMKALANMTERDRLLSFWGQRDSISMMMEVFSERGTQQSLIDFDIFVKSFERGEIEMSTIVEAKKEACQFIAEHAVNAAMATASDSEWKTLRAKLSEHTVVFLVQDPKSCLADGPFRQKLGMVRDAAKNSGIAPSPALMHRELILLLTKEPVAKRSTDKKQRDR